MTYRTTPLLAVTYGDLRTWGACYSDDRIIQYFAGAASLTPRQIAEQDIKATDKVWVLVRCLRTADCVVFARRCADSAAAAAAAYDATRSDADAAGDASASAGDASAAYDAARSGAARSGAAGSAAAYDATTAAAYDAARSAAGYSGYARARVQQIAWLLELLGA